MIVGPIEGHAFVDIENLDMLGNHQRNGNLSRAKMAGYILDFPIVAYPAMILGFPPASA
jgi:hypothetical protein